MTIKETKINGVYIIEPTVYEDGRGAFCETWNQKDFTNEIGIDTTFVQMNQSKSKLNVLRGLHYQVKYPQAKLVWVGLGSVLDVFVDLREDSDTFGQHDSCILRNNTMLYIPEGCAHGFYAKSDQVQFNYLVSDYRYQEFERTLLWNDPDLNINWGTSYPILSEKDKQGHLFKDYNLHI